MSFGKKYVLLANRVLERVNLGPAFTQLGLDARKCIKSQAKVDLAFNFGHFLNIQLPRAYAAVR